MPRATPDRDDSRGNMAGQGGPQRGPIGSASDARQQQDEAGNTPPVLRVAPAASGVMEATAGTLRVGPDREMDMNDQVKDSDVGVGLAGRRLAERDKDDLDGTGGSSGGGTIAGAGTVSGGTTDRSAGPADLAGTAHGAATEAAALGSADGSLADLGQRSNPGADVTGAEAIGAGAGRGEAGSGTPPDRSGAGGGGGGPGPRGMRSPGGQNPG
jgi:hypothetical protein